MHINFLIIWLLNCVPFKIAYYFIREKNPVQNIVRVVQRERRKIPTYPIYDTSSIHKRHLIPFFPATGQNELCPHFPGDSTFSKLVPRPSAASQGQHRRAHRPAMTGKTSQRSCPFETSTSFSDHEKVQFSGSSRVLRSKEELRYEED